MADRARKYIEITADATGALKELKRLNAVTATSEKHLRGIGSVVKDLGYTLRSLGLYLLVDEFINLADAAANLNSQLLAVTDSAAEADAVFAALLTVANENGVAVDSLGGAFTRLQTALPNVSASNIVETLDLLATTLAKTGAGTQQANSVMLQFAQGMGSAALQGDEFRAVAENAPTLINAWAASIGKADVAFKDLSSSAALTAKSFYENLEAIQAYQDELLGTGPPVLTLGRAFQQLRNNVIALFADVGEGGGFENLAEGIVSVANGVGMLEVPLNTAIELLGALIELASSVGSVMADLGSVVGSSLAGVSDAVVGLFSEGEAELIDYADLFAYTFQVKIPGTVEAFGYAVEIVWEGLKTATQALVSSMVELWPQVKVAGLEAFGALSTGVQNIVVSMVNYVLEKIEALANNTIGIINGLISELNSVLPGDGLGLVGGVEFTRVAAGIDEVSTALAGARAESAAVTEQQEAYRQSLKDSFDALVATKAGQLEANELKREDALITKDLKTETVLATEANKAFATATAGGGGSGGAAGAAKKLGDAAAKAAEEMERLRDAYTAILEREYPAIAAANKHAEEVEKLSLAFQKGAISLEEFTKGVQLSSKYMGETQEKIGDTKKELDTFGKALKDVGDGFADAFTDLLTGGIDSAEDFVNELKDVLIGGIKSIISDLSKQAFNVVVNAVVNTSGTTDGITGESSGGFSLSNISKFFSGNSIGESISSGLTKGFDKLGITIGDKLNSGLTNIAGASNLALTAGSLLGGLAGSLLFEGGYSSIGSSIGSTAGSVIGSALLPGVGTVIGGLLGGVGGGFLGSLFGEDDRTPYVSFGVQNGGIRGAGGWGISAEDQSELGEYIGDLNDTLTTLGEVLGPEAQQARFNYNAGASVEFDPEWAEAFLTGVTREILQAMVEAVPGQLGELYLTVVNAAGADLEATIEALDELTTYVLSFGAAVNAIKPGAFTEMEQVATAMNQIALADIPAVTEGLVTLAELMESLKTSSEKAADAQARVNEVFEETGLAVPKTVAELRQLVASLDLTTADGLYASQAISTVAEDLQLLLKVSEDTATAVDDLGNELSDLEAFIAGLQSEADRNSQALVDMVEVFRLWGLEMPATEQALYDMIQAGAFTDEQLESLSANATKLGYAFSALETIVEEEIEALEEASAARISVWEAETDAAIALIQAQQDARIDALNAEKDAINDRIADLREPISGLQSIIDSARKAVFDLGTQAAFGVDENRQRLLGLARAGIESGALPANVSDIISGLRTVNVNDFATREEYLAAVSENQKVLDELAMMGEEQLTEGERQIELLEDQLDAIDDQIDAIGDQTSRLIAAEEAALAKRIAAEEKALAEQTAALKAGDVLMLDALERIYTVLDDNLAQSSEDQFQGSTPPTNSWISPANASVSTFSPYTSTASSGGEAQLLASIVATNQEMARIIKRWNGEGLPPDRNDYLRTIAGNTA